MTAMSDWTERAACRDQDLEIWFSDRTRKQAKATCDECPVQEPCLEAVMTAEAGMGKHLRIGIYAGLTGPQRAQLARQQKEQRSAGG
jgi:hypothetical protein